jgi:hypothetical protein
MRRRCFPSRLSLPWSACPRNNEKDRKLAVQSKSQWATADSDCEYRPVAIRWEPVSGLLNLIKLKPM